MYLVCPLCDYVLTTAPEPPSPYHITTHHSSTSHTSLITAPLLITTHHRSTSHTSRVAGPWQPFSWQAQYTQSLLEELRRAWPPLARGCLSCGRRSTQSFLAELLRAWPPPAAGFRVAGAVHRASWTSCWARGGLSCGRRSTTEPPGEAAARVAVTHTIFHPPSCHTHTHTHHLSHPIFRTTLLDTIFHTSSLTHHLSHTTLSDTIFHTPSFTQLCHTPSFTHHLSHTTCHCPQQEFAWHSFVHDQNVPLSLVSRTVRCWPRSWMTWM